MKGGTIFKWKTSYYDCYLFITGEDIIIDSGVEGDINISHLSDIWGLIEILTILAPLFNMEWTDRDKFLTVASDEVEPGVFGEPYLSWQNFEETKAFQKFASDLLAEFAKKLGIRFISSYEDYVDVIALLEENFSQNVPLWMISIEDVSDPEYPEEVMPAGYSLIILDCYNSGNIDDSVIYPLLLPDAEKMDKLLELPSQSLLKSLKYNVLGPNSSDNKFKGKSHYNISFHYSTEKVGYGEIDCSFRLNTNITSVSISCNAVASINTLDFSSIAAEEDDYYLLSMTVMATTEDDGGVLYKGFISTSKGEKSFQIHNTAGTVDPYLKLIQIDADAYNSTAYILGRFLHENI